MNTSDDMSSDSDEKVVQTRLSASEYERFRRIADEEGISLKEALRRAVTAYTGTHERHDIDDPFFDGAANSDTDAEHDEQLTAEKTDSYLYGDG
jgi:hypothetical protein